MSIPSATRLTADNLTELRSYDLRSVAQYHYDKTVRAAAISKYIEKENEDRLRIVSPAERIEPLRFLSEIAVDNKAELGKPYVSELIRKGFYDVLILASKLEDMTPELRESLRAGIDEAANNLIDSNADHSTLLLDVAMVTEVGQTVREHATRIAIKLSTDEGDYARLIRIADNEKNPEFLRNAASEAIEPAITRAIFSASASGEVGDLIIILKQELKPEILAIATTAAVRRMTDKFYFDFLAQIMDMPINPDTMETARANLNSMARKLMEIEPASMEYIRFVTETFISDPLTERLIKVAKCKHVDEDLRRDASIALIGLNQHSLYELGLIAEDDSYLIDIRVLAGDLKLSFDTANKKYADIASFISDKVPAELKSRACIFLSQNAEEISQELATAGRYDLLINFRDVTAGSAKMAFLRSIDEAVGNRLKTAGLWELINIKHNEKLSGPNRTAASRRIASAAKRLVNECKEKNPEKLSEIVCNTNVPLSLRIAAGLWLVDYLAERGNMLSLAQLELNINTPPEVKHASGKKTDIALVAELRTYQDASKTYFEPKSDYKRIMELARTKNQALQGEVSQALSVFVSNLLRTVPRKLDSYCEHSYLPILGDIAKNQLVDEAKRNEVGLKLVSLVCKDESYLVGIAEDKRYPIETRNAAYNAIVALPYPNLLRVIKAKDAPIETKLQAAEKYLEMTEYALDILTDLHKCDLPEITELVRPKIADSFQRELDMVYYSSPDYSHFVRILDSVEVLPPNHGIENLNAKIKNAGMALFSNMLKKGLYYLIISMAEEKRTPALPRMCCVNALVQSGLTLFLSRQLPDDEKRLVGKPSTAAAGRQLKNCT
ncbi:MAG: hypothetical protein WCT31_04960 [Candidatus Micrarchaeia archaeon]